MLCLLLGILHLVIGGARRDAAGGELALALEFALLVGERVLGRSQFGELLAIGRLHRLDLQPRRGEHRLCFLDRDAERPIVEPEQHLALGHALVVADLDRNDAARDIGADHRARRLDVGVVGRDIAPARQVPPCGGDQNDERPRQHERQPQPLTQWTARARPDCGPDLADDAAKATDAGVLFGRRAHRATSTAATGAGVASAS